MSNIGAVDQVTLRRRGAGLIAHEPGRSGPGYTLVAPQTGGGKVYLLAMDGTVAHEWAMPCRPGRHAVLLPNGNLGFNGHLPGTPNHYAAWTLWHGGAFMEVTPAGQVVWEHTDPLHHHDAQWLPNGHLLYGAMERLSPEFARRIVGNSTPNDLQDGTVWGDVVKEVDRSGAVVWQWRAADHLHPAEFPVQPIFDRYHWPLINGLWSARNGLVLMSLRTTSGIIGVDRASGRVVLKIKYPVVAQQHSPVEMDNGCILAFDNGNLRPGSSSPYSRAVEVDPATGAVVWQYADMMRPAFFSPYMGAAQRLANGNTHITESATGRLFDVTPDGEVVWEYVIPFFAEYPDAETRAYSPGQQNSVFRSYRYTPDQVPWL